MVETAAERDPQIMAYELVEKHGLGATRIAAEKHADLYYEDADGKREFWRQVARFTVPLLVERGLLPREE